MHACQLFGGRRSKMGEEKVKKNGGRKSEIGRCNCNALTYFCAAHVTSCSENAPILPVICEDYRNHEQNKGVQRPCASTRQPLTMIVYMIMLWMSLPVCGQVHKVRMHCTCACIAYVHRHLRCAGQPSGAYAVGPHCRRAYLSSTANHNIGEC